MRTYRNPKSNGKIHWGNRVQIYQPVRTGDLTTTWFQVPYSGTPQRGLIERALRKTAPRDFFGLTYEPQVTKIDHVEGVVIVKLTQASKDV